MIETKEIIGDPVAFLEADPKLVTDALPNDNLYFRDGLVISGADIDMCVYSDTHIGAESPPDSDGLPVSSFLGNLYVVGAIHWVMLEGRRFNVNYYPSPTTVTDLMEKLGIRPGEDAPRFVHASGRYNAKGDIPANLFVEHFMNREYAQSTTKSNFDHDRGDDHAIGAILMPPSITARLPEVALSGLRMQNINPNWHTHPPGAPISRAAEGFDSLTSSIGDLAEELSTRPQSEPESVTDEKLSGLSFTLGGSRYTSNEYLQRLWGIDQDHLPDRARFAVYAGSLVNERLLELSPAVEAAQAELDIAA